MWNPASIAVLATVPSLAHSDSTSVGWERRPARRADGQTANRPNDPSFAWSSGQGYATEDKNLHIRHSLGGKVVGSTLMPQASYRSSIQIDDPDGAKDAVKLVEIVSDGGRVVTSEAFSSAHVSWSPTVSSSTARYFYVRVTTASDFWGTRA